MLDEGELNHTAIDITTNESDGLKEFGDGYLYVYTDKSLVEKYRAGDADTPYDLTSQKVAKTSSNRGEKENPYVITSVADWEIFVKLCGTNLNNSTGKYFVLANDLDFSGVDFRPVGKFGGTFYGMGHKLVNINCSNWQKFNGTRYVAIGTSGQTNSGFGIFGSVSNATITDLINENFEFSNIPQTSANGVSTSGSYGPHIGAIAGISIGNNTFLNCHTSGKVSSKAYTTSVQEGGIVGTHKANANNKTIYVYRCSSNFTTSLIGGTTTSGMMIGGILGQSWAATTILDCASEVNATNNGTNGYQYIGSIFGWSESVTEMFWFENLVGKVNVNSTVLTTSSGSIAGIRGTTNLKFSNLYGEGSVGTTSKLSFLALVHFETQPTKGFSNINNVKTSTNYASLLPSRSDTLGKISGEPTVYSTSNEMLSDARTFFGASPYSRIWDTSKIGESYEPENSPVRNYMDLPLMAPTDIETTYNGEEQNFINASGASSWYNSVMFSADYANVKIEYLPTALLTTSMPIESGTYTIRFTIQNAGYVWSNGKVVQDIDFTINKKPLNVNLDTNSTPPKATPVNLCSRDSDLADDILKIRYTAKDYNDFVPPTNTDIYTATVEIDDSVSNNYVLSKAYNVQYLGMPTILDTGVPTYNGTEQQYYIQYVNSADSGEIDVSIPEEFRDLVTFSDGEIRVTNAGKYWLNLNIHKTDGTVMWSTRDADEKRLEFEVRKAPLALDIKSGGSANIEATKGEKVKVTIDSMQKVCANDVIALDIVAVMSNLDTVRRTVYSNLRIDNDTAFPFSIDLDTQDLAATGWILTFVASGSDNSNANYDVAIGNAPVTITVKSVGTENSLRWTFMRDGKEVGIYNQSTSDLADECFEPIYYNGLQVSASAKANDYVVDTTYNS
ncbi:MAG: hypothetical protein OSJ74_08385, partial [Clostridia bacterium]|nr:hypothetical protein [Clostridia bacterium]